MHEVKVGQKYRRAGVWGVTAPGEDVCVVDLVGSGRVNYTYESGRSDYSSTDSFYSSDRDYEASDDGLVGFAVFILIPEAENNQLSPNVYQFPNGVEVKDISAHLTSFGGQAVQYIARATRLDGVVKGLPIQDLYKAIELLKWEAERMEALQK